VYQKIQNAGCSIELHPVSVTDAKETIQHLHPEEVWLKMWGLSEAEARALVSLVEKRSN